MDASELPTSGQKKVFPTGSQRDGDTGRGRYHLIPPCAIHALAKRFEQGAENYGANNWMKGMPLSRLQDSISRHLLAASEGDESEDHIGAILWNAAAWMWTENAIKEGQLPPELDDRIYNNG